MSLVQVKNEATLKRDTDSNAILETDAAQLEAYKKRREEWRRNNQKFHDIQHDINTLKSQLEQINKTLTQLVAG